MPFAMTLPGPIRWVLDRLEGAGYEAYVVGGCVRDALMGLEPKDYDVCTSALPEQTLAVFAGCRVVETGLAHGTVTVLAPENGGSAPSVGGAPCEGSMPCEVTTFRVDGGYTDHRHPDQVTFVRSLREDLARRDFTVNAMAYHPARGLCDPFGGQEDLRLRRIRCVGQASRRFEEDALRILRALRFAAVCDFAVEAETAAACRAQSGGLHFVARERITAELGKMLCGKAAQRVAAEFSGVLEAVVPPPLHIEGLQAVPPEVPLRLAHLLACEPRPEEALRALRLDRETQRAVRELIAARTTPMPSTRVETLRLLRALGPVRAGQLARLMGWPPSCVEAPGGCFSVRQLAVTGGDLLALGARPGPALGGLLEKLLDAVIEGRVPNEKAALERMAKCTLYKNGFDAIIGKEPSQHMEVGTMKDAKFTQLYEMAKKELLGNILPFWMEHDVDEENGGFYGVVTREGVPVKEGTKCLVLNARLVWTFASAWRILKEEKYLKLAQRAYDYFCEHFIDKEYGGCYFMLDCKGNPVDDKKFVYGQAFAIYALSEYCRATGDTAARDKAVAIMELLEAHAYDAEHPGYIEILSRDWSYNPAAQGSNINPDSQSTKTMNTHLHLIEAYTCLLRVLPTEAQAAKVREHLNIMLDKVYDPSISHFKMFFRDDWTPTSPDISYGHDIEGTWLMMETAEVLGQKDMEEKAAPRCLKMAEACLNESILPDGSMIHEYNPVTRHIETKRSWWVQAETVVGFLNAWQMSGEEKFLNASLECFRYIDRFVVDHEYGEWFTMLGDSGEILSGYESKIDGWKCPYHNARMCFEIIERYEKE